MCMHGASDPVANGKRGVLYSGQWQSLEAGLPNQVFGSQTTTKPHEKGSSVGEDSITLSTKIVSNK